MGSLGYPPTFEPDREVEYKASREQEIGRGPGPGSCGNHARYQERGAQAGNAPIQPRAQLVEKGLGARRTRLAFR